MNAPGQRDPASYSAPELADPRIDPTTLRHIAAVRPDLRPLIRDHPNCDQGLADYIRQNEPPSASPPPAPPGAQPPGAQPQPPTGAPPPVGPPQPGGPPQGPPQPQPGVQGAQQMATGAAPPVGQMSGQASGTWTIWFRIALPVLALLGIMSLFMPIASASYMGTSTSINYFSEDAPDGEGVIMLIAFGLFTGFAAVSLLTSQKWARITAGVLAIIVGLVAMLNGFGTAALISEEPHGSVGAGAIFLGITGIALIAAAIITFLPQKQPAAQYA